jgi:ubiquinone/menaquinone biosynthesis C-methylase UbiE
MGNEFSDKSFHSAEYFGDTRDHWWNQDFLELMAQRWKLSGVRDVLDVGCGVGHWGRLLERVLPKEARVIGIDRDPFWIEKATGRAGAAGLTERFQYQVAVAEELPFKDGTFDLVTCQTVLIHARDPGATLAEMIRVVKPGGLVVVAEPNNAASSLILDTATFNAPVDDIVAMVRFQLVCERGKAALNEGNNSAGELMPALFAERGLADIQVYLNDKASPLFPPYTSQHARALIDEMVDFADRDFWCWSREDTRRYFLAGGGSEEELNKCWSAALAGSKRAAESIKQGTYAAAGGALCYLVSGRRPAANG